MTSSRYLAGKQDTQCEYGKCRAQRTQLLSQRDNTNSTQDTLKWFQIPPKNPWKSFEGKTSRTLPEAKQKNEFWQPVPPSCTPKAFQIGLQKTQRHSKIKNLYPIPKNNNFGYALELSEEGFGTQNESLLDTFGNTFAIVS